MSLQQGAQGSNFDVDRSSRYAGGQAPRLIRADVFRRNVADQFRSEDFKQGLECVFVQVAGIARVAARAFPG